MNKIVLLITLAAIFFSAYAKVDTIYVNSLEEFEKSLLDGTVEIPTIQYDIQYETQYNNHSEYNLRRSNGLIAGGITLIALTGGAVPTGAMVGVIGLAFEEGSVVLLGTGILASGVVGIVGGIKMIGRGKQIRRQNRRLSFDPYINPLENSYGANLSFSF